MIVGASHPRWMLALMSFDPRQLYGPAARANILWHFVCCQVRLPCVTRNHAVCIPPLHGLCWRAASCERGGGYFNVENFSIIGPANKGTLSLHPAYIFNATTLVLAATANVDKISSF